MKRKLRLLVAVVLTLAMVMGMSVTALAEEYIESVEIDFANSNVAGATLNQIKEDMTITADSEYDYVKISFIARSSTPDDPDPTPAPTPTPTHTPAPTLTPTSVKKGTLEMVAVDHDTFKSEAPSKTVIASGTLGANSFFDLKVHAADDDRTKANQKFLVQTLTGPNAKILITENIYPGRDLSTTENGSLQTLTWNNLPKNQAGPVYAVVYNQTDKAYVISGMVDANGTAVFTGFKLRPASTITICK